MKKYPYSQILDEVANDQIPPYLDLAPIITAKIQKGKGMRTQYRVKLISAVMLVVTALVVLFYAVPGVAAAIGHWFGYVPGAGLVREGMVRVLEEPVSVTRDGITVTVDQVVLDTQRTALVYSVDGIPSDVLTTDLGEQCTDQVTLRLPDGTQLTGSGGGYFGQSYQHRYDFPPLAADVEDASLIANCLFGTRRGAAPENWDLPLHFVPAPPDITAFPVIGIATPTATATAAAAAPAAEAPSPVTPAPAVMSLTLDRAVQMDDGYLLYATLYWQDTPYSLVEVLNPNGSLRLLDGRGKEMLYDVNYDELTGPDPEQRQTGIVIKTAPVQTDGPLTLALNAVSVDLPVDASFTFDPGLDSKPGQTWPLDEKVKIGDQTLRVHSASASESGYTFEMSSDTGITRAILVDLEHPVAGGGGGGGGGTGDPLQFFSAGISYANGLPAGPVRITVTAISLELELSEVLQAQWTPPAGSTTLLPTQPAACLTASAWAAALAQKPGLPEGLPGKVLVYGPTENTATNGAWVTSVGYLDGSTSQIIPGARDGALSPDGSQVAYSTLDTGLSILDLASGSVTPVPGTIVGDFNPLWSPDGKQIVLMRGAGVFDLFVVEPDGSNLRQLTFGGVQENLVGWLPDGSVLYNVPGQEYEVTVYRLDLQTGESQEFSRDNIQAVSPDGKHMIVAEMSFGDRWLMSVSDLDGSNRWPVAASDLWIQTTLWSPDGQWLLAGISNTGYGETIGALINLRSCQVIPLPHLKGVFLAWGQ